MAPGVWLTFYGPWSMVYVVWCVNRSMGGTWTTYRSDGTAILRKSGEANALGTSIAISVAVERRP